MVHEDRVESPRKVRRTAVRSFAPVTRVALEEVAFVLESLGDRSLVVNVALSTVDNGDVTESERDDAPGEDIDNVRSLIHQVDFGQDSDRSISLGVDFAREFESVRVGQIGVGGGDGKNDRVGLLNELEEHVSNLDFNVAGLISDGDLGETGKIDESESEDVGRKDSKTDRKRRDSCRAQKVDSAQNADKACISNAAGLTCVLSRLQFRVGDDLLSDFVEVEEFLSRSVKLPHTRASVLLCKPTERSKEVDMTHEFGPFVRVARLVARRLRSRFIGRSYRGRSGPSATSSPK